MHSLRMKARKSGTQIKVTDIRPGFVDTDMAKGDRIIWIASPEKAARQIYLAIRKKKKVAYISRRWRLFAFLMKLRNIA
jgi:short-subunit dehydrogenase